MIARRLDLELRARSRTSARAGMLLLVAAVTAAGALGWRHHEQGVELEALERHLQRRQAAEARAEPLRGGTGEVRAALLEVKHVARVQGQLDVPWDDLFSALESAMTPDVALLAIESDTEQRKVTLSGEARHLAGILEYVRGLRARPVLDEVYLARHDVHERDSQRPVRFVVTATWAQGAGAAP